MAAVAVQTMRTVEPPVSSTTGVDRDLSLSTIRFSLGWATREEEIERVGALLPRLVEELRSGPEAGR